jgi:hypothetical protein
MAAAAGDIPGALAWSTGRVGGNRRSTPTFTSIPFAGGEPPLGHGSPIRMPRVSCYSRPLQADRLLCCEGRISSRLLPPSPDIRCHKFVTAHGSVVKESGKALGLSLQGGDRPSMPGYRLRRCIKQEQE